MHHLWTDLKQFWLVELFSISKQPFDFEHCVRYKFSYKFDVLLCDYSMRALKLLGRKTVHRPAVGKFEIEVFRKYIHVYSQSSTLSLHHSPQPLKYNWKITLHFRGSPLTESNLIKHVQCANINVEWIYSHSRNSKCGLCCECISYTNFCITKSIVFL